MLRRYRGYLTDWITGESRTIPTDDQHIKPGYGPFIGLWPEKRSGTWHFVPMRYTKEGHLMMIAPSRSGKARDVLIASLLTTRNSCIVVDIKGELAAITARARRALGHRIVCINPFGLHSGAPWHLPQHGFNPLERLDPASPNFTAGLEGLGGAVVVHDSQESAHWSSSARALFAGLVCDEVVTAKREGRTPSLGRVRSYIVMSDDDFERCMQAKIEAAATGLVADRLTQFVRLTNESRSVRSTLKAQSTFMSDAAIVAALERDDIDFADLKGEEPITVYIILPSSLIVPGMTYARFIRLLLQSAIDTMMATPKRHNRPVWMVVDEMYSLGSMPVLERTMSEGAGYGILLQPIIQNLGQLKELYRNNWETFIANSSCTTFFAPRDNTTAEYVSKLLGQYTAQTQTINARGEVSHGETGRPLLRTEEVMQLAEHQMLVLLRDCPNPLLMCRSPYFKETWGLAGSFDPNPYHVE